MKILHVDSTIGPVSGGGTGERTYQLSKHLASVGVDCTVLTTTLGMTKKRINELASVKLIQLPCLWKRFFIPKVSYQTLKRIVSDADVVHLMNHWTLLNALVYLVCRRVGKRYVVCPAGALGIYGRSKSMKKLYNYVIGRKLIVNADYHVMVTLGEAQQFLDYGVGLERTAVIPNGVDSCDYTVTDEVQFRGKYHLGNVPYILFMGRLNPIKGPDLLLKAFISAQKHIGDVNLVFAGPDGGMLASLEREVAKNNLQGRVVFTGYLADGEKTTAYKAARLLVIPSRQEAMSIVVLEAGINGLPVLLSDQCGFGEAEEVGGGMAVPATSEGLERGLISILKDCDRLHSMGENLKRHVEAHYTWDAAVEKYIALYKRIIADNKFQKGY